MASISDTLYRDSEFGVEMSLPKSGSALEHPLVYDAVARDSQCLARRGLVEIVHQHETSLGEDTLIDDLRYRKRG